MNTIAATILWMSVQIGLFSFVGFATFVLLRRRGPSTAAACCALVLGLTLPLAAMVVSPWPRWSLEAASKPADNNHALNRSVIVQSNTANGDQNHELPSLASSVASDDSISTLSIWWQAAVDWVRNGGQANSVDAGNRLTWQACLPWLIAAGVGYCLLRTVAGLWAMSRLRRSSRPIDEPALRATMLEIVEMIDGPQLTVRQRRSVGPAAKRDGRALRSGDALEVCETAALRSAATIGWRRPVLLLPSDWRTWTETERRVVLAHELAHVARRDYLTSVVARLATSIHFYQPLVLWLSRQLRIQQELAADSHAAAIAGGRQTYLTTLAQMALRADETPIPWAARAFLPGTSMLIKRVAWLKQKGDQKEMTMNRKTRLIFTAAMVAVALAVAGLDPGDESTSAMAAADDPKPAAKNSEPAPATLERKPLRTFDYIPADAKLVFVASPRVLLKSATVQQLQKLIVMGDVEKHLGVTLREIEDIKVIQTKGNIFQSGPKPPFQRIVVRTTEPHDWKKWITDKPGAKPKQLGDKTIFEIDGDIALIPDDRTIVALVGYDEVQVKQIVLGAEKLRADDMSAFPALIYSPVAVWADTQSMKADFNLPNAPLDPVSMMLRSLLEHTASATAWASLDQPTAATGQERLNAALQLTCDSADAAKQTQSLLDAGRTFLKLMGTTTDSTERQQLDKLQPDQRKLAELKLSMLKLGVQFLDAIALKVEGPVATAQVDFPVPLDTIAALLGPAMTASREAAMRAQSMNNMKQLGLALHIYASANKHFPPAAICDKDGKPLLSWRVAILPFLEQKPLYDQFHLDEPWDSEHNKALIAKMPASLRDPHEDATSTSASYFMPTGPGTIGEKPKGTQLKEITDGTSRTIMLIDAKRDIPWTKPEDIEIDPDATKPLPKFGGHLPDGLFGVAFADGSVHTFSLGVLDANMLRALFTIAGGELVALP